LVFFIFHGDSISIVSVREHEAGDKAAHRRIFFSRRAHRRDVYCVRGYLGEDHFGRLLGVLIDRLDASGTGGERAQLPEKTLRATD
jgi:hypothetical protein